MFNLKSSLIILCAIVAIGQSQLTPAVWSNAYNTLIMSYTAYCPLTTIQNWNCNSYICNPNTGNFFQGFQVLNAQVNSIQETTSTGWADILHYVAVKDNNYYLTFRGSNNTYNWYYDALSIFIEADYSINVPNSKVSLGFFDAWNDLQPAVINSLYLLLNTDCSSNPCNLQISGHSLGGAIANTYPGLHVTVNTYGSPRVGNAEFANYYDSRVPNTLRFVNFEDVIPHVPFEGDFFTHYQHVNEEVWVDVTVAEGQFTVPPSNSIYKVCPTTEDPSCSDSCSFFEGSYCYLDTWQPFLYHQRYFGFNLETFCNHWDSVIVTPEPTQTPNPLAYPIITQTITSQWNNGQGVNYTTVVGRLNNNSTQDIVDPVFVTTPNILPIGIFGMKTTTVNGTINWRISPAGSYATTMLHNSFIDFSYTINSNQMLSFTRIK
ncbi:hypothetical protein PPL_00162 [Heterostelium album PN500]|uniref:Fungal lipase-type domain-containing protein n=1 Tax=Heterostelium pallidum (strain ATCC 26659 / Pp 5 / PN500) TaxID=670386 RepID=D3AVP7_HETP5|nr:hypothetical protein PPL_00162 [Heterostelium album PN500]EFA86370.1 hypothetical protein PPL_00162 [Heterostelium album PN500]|eukprot:XP_020438475.1 hypothetical protein PPL_00162 [Heterostelium album PN500]